MSKASCMPRHERRFERFDKNTVRAATRLLRMASAARRRFERFDKITVRAATRLLRMASAARLTEHEVDCYVSELAALEPRPGRWTAPRLKRLARWRACLAAPGTAARGSNRASCGTALRPAAR